MGMIAAADVSGADVERDGPGVLARRVAGPFAVTAVVLTAATVAVGLAVTRDLAGLSTLDLDVGRALAERRSPGVDGIAALVGAISGPFPVAIAFGVAIVASAVATRRWTVPAFIAVALGGEALVFLVGGLVVGRERPPVEPIGQVHATSSFPSGHVGFALILVGGSIAAVLWQRSMSGRSTARVVTVLAVATTVLVVLVVAWARLWSGQHHLTDVVWGVVLGACWLAVAWRVVLVPTPRPTSAPASHPTAAPARHPTPAPAGRPIPRPIPPLPP